MTPSLRRLSLTAHVTTSVGWLGAVASFLALSIAGLTSGDAEVVRAAYVAMNLVGAFVILPLSVLALITGIVESLGTHWGLLRYYWVIAKLVLTGAAVFVLLLHQFTAVEEAARRVGLASPGIAPEVGGLGIQLAVDAGGAVLVLLVVTALGIFKPWGLTRFGLSATRGVAAGAEAARLPTGVKISLAVVLAILAAIAVIHLTGGGLGHH